ncbi:anhydro-N-acetylmuramic acid kinase [Robbsia sp. Bb-Pol-6]|uniref:Anhydro-N-acetylmuramic acid kinase n=1 Tax=Robbsia betulipollinis TaxID=2981849 RepID=A0ABT3ZLD1_9BURK|nr:anhydro-N-acetylmuramic acid kinase [Robbsia betulipollinis]MCY0387351.1 anhydro-N-acetylmuramic acid kinase [Robbsia betulipollinis]
MHVERSLYIGLMSGTSMDGVDGVIARFDAEGRPHPEAEAHIPFDAPLRDALFALQSPGDNEIEREALAANQLADTYATCCERLLQAHHATPEAVVAIGVHGQTIRHRPERGYTRQTNNPARLAERAGIDVIADFRSRDVAAGGQGAPLVPAFHAAVFGAPGHTRVICNIGGISNVSILQGREAARGFDCGPGNALLDAWAGQHLGQPFDAEGRFAARGSVHAPLLAVLLAEPFLALPPPKSTGRDLFNPAWLETKLTPFADLDPADVQATLTALTAEAIARDVALHAPGCDTVFVCGGGARNPVLLDMLRQALTRARAAGAVARTIAVESTQRLGIDPQQVEALAFAWLARRFVEREPGNLAAVTGAAGPRVLGALYPR